MRKKRNGTPELVILDHGLYIQESEKFRLAYGNLWRAMILTDTKKLQSICEGWGIKDSELFASFQMMKKYGAVDRTQAATRKDLYELQIRTKERAKVSIFTFDRYPEKNVFLAFVTRFFPHTT